MISLFMKASLGSFWSDVSQRILRWPIGLVQRLELDVVVAVVVAAASPASIVG
jgi:hypothetical protein